MPPLVRIAAPFLMLAAGGWLLRAAFIEFGKWRAQLAIGDPSGAELYELNFQLNVAPALVLLLAGAFLAGRWWFRG